MITLDRAIELMEAQIGEMYGVTGVILYADDISQYLKQFRDLTKMIEPERTAKVMGEDGYHWHACNDCDQKVEEEWVYCPFCGKRLEWE